MGLSGRLLASLGYMAQPRLLFAVWLGWLTAWPRGVSKAGCGQRQMISFSFIRVCHVMALVAHKLV